MKVEIPEFAMPVVKALRRDVKKPQAKLFMDDVPKGRAPRFECGKCPMGLLPSAQTEAPDSLADFQPPPNFRYPALAVFWLWWDNLSLEQAREAVDLIWPQEAQQGE